MQDVCFLFGWLWPASQSAQAAPPVENFPSTQSAQVLVDCASAGVLCPLSQALHVAPVPSNHLPIGQSSHTPMLDFCPRGHGVQSAAFSAAPATEVFPSSQSVQVAPVCPCPAYFPIGQFLHSVPEAYLPASQTSAQLGPAFAPPVLLLPLVQGLQTPSVTEYFPSGQAEHAPFASIP